MITIDFETYYDKEFSLSKITTEEYIRSEQFEVIGVAAKVDDQQTQWCTGSKEQIAKFYMTLIFLVMMYWLTTWPLMGQFLRGSLGYDQSITLIR